MPKKAAPQVVIRRFQCRHVFADGHRCSSPCLRYKHLCYYHETTRNPQPRPGQPSSLPHDSYNNPPNQTAFTLPLPEDHSSIQLAIGTIMTQLASNALDPRRAGLLLYALQIASGNLATAPKHDVSEIVHRVTFDRNGKPLAPENRIKLEYLTRQNLETMDEVYSEKDEDVVDDETEYAEQSAAQVEVTNENGGDESQKEKNAETVDITASPQDTLANGIPSAKRPPSPPSAPRQQSRSHAPQRSKNRRRATPSAPKPSPRPRSTPLSPVSDVLCRKVPGGRVPSPTAPPNAPTPAPDPRSSPPRRSHPCS